MANENTEWREVARLLAIRLANGTASVVEDLVTGLRRSAVELASTSFAPAYMAAADLLADEWKSTREYRAKNGKCPECGWIYTHRQGCPDVGKPLNPVPPMEDGGYAEASDRR